MVSFQCDGCADTVKKPKLDQHRQRCWASFTCLDCSKTFQNQEYKSHTSCISEAEKYQGALYKGPKKGGQNGYGQQQQNRNQPRDLNNFTSAPPPPPSTDATASAPATAAIHPSRLTQIENTASSSGPSSEQYGYGGGSFGGRGGYGGRGGRGGRGGMRGGAFGGPGAGGEGRVPKGRGPMFSGENKRAPEGGMRSWGGGSTTPSIAPESNVGSPAPTIASSTTLSVPAFNQGQSSLNGMNGGETEKKNKKKKGDKGGTGSKANSKRPKEITEEPSTGPSTEEPALKKRKRSTSPAPASTSTSTPSATVETSVNGSNANGEISDKTLKRLRKNAAKVAEKATATEVLGLGEWMKKISEGKKEQVDLGEVNRAAKVSYEDGKWVLSF